MITSTTSPLKLCHSLSAKIREDHMTKWGVRDVHVSYSKIQMQTIGFFWGCLLIASFLPVFSFSSFFLVGVG